VTQHHSSPTAAQRCIRNTEYISEAAKLYIREQKKVQQKTEQHSRDSSEAPDILIEDNLLAEQHTIVQQKTEQH
jgi:hypothetical protein